MMVIGNEEHKQRANISAAARQIKHFFISFSKEVEIVSPALLREEFVAFYAAALGVYEEES